jgi:tetratricopeptide (TPR) repeat protein
MKVEETASEEISAPVSEAKVVEAVAEVAEIEPEEIPVPVSEASVEEVVAEIAAAEPEEVPAPVSEVTVEETVTEVVTIVSEIKVEETVTEIAAPADEAKVEEPVAEIPAGTEEEETPLTLHEKKFDLLQVVESVIEKVEKAYAENKKQKAVEEAPAEAELPVASEEPALEVEALTQVNEDIRPEAMPIAQIVEEASPEPVTEEAEAPVASEEVTQIVELTEKVTVEVSNSLADDLSEEELAQRNETRRAPAWLKIKAEKKIEEKVTTDENGIQQEVTQVESVTVLSEIPQEASVSDTVEKMEIVETYTDPLAAQLTTEPSLSEEPIHSEATEQIEVPAKQEAEAEAQEPVAAEESAVAEEVSVASDEETLEAAYEEYLKDSAEPAALKDHVDALQDDTPLTKVGKNGEVRIAMDTKNAHVWNELGNIYLNAGTFDEAIASYSKAIELDRQFAWPYSNLALAYVQKGRFAEAILLYQRGIELFTSDRDKAVTWNRLGNVYRRIHDYKNAIASYQTADELDPENATLSLRNSFGLLEKMYSDSKPAYAPQ